MDMEINMFIESAERRSAVAFGVEAAYESMRESCAGLIAENDMLRRCIWRAHLALGIVVAVIVFHAVLKQLT